jgi:hypothetical protein
MTLLNLKEFKNNNKIPVTLTAGITLIITSTVALVAVPPLAISLVLTFLWILSVLVLYL